MDSKVYKSLPTISQDSLELASRHRVALAVSEVIYKFMKSANLLIVFIGLGFWKRRREGFGSSDTYLLYIFVALFLISVFYTRQLYYFSTRHGLTLVLVTLFFAGHGLDFMAEAISKGFKRFGPRWALMNRYIPHIITILLVILFLAQGLSGQGREKATIKEIGIWLKEKGYQGSVIMGDKRFLRIAFYADGTFLEMPDSWEKAMDSIHRNGVKIVVIDSCTIEQDCPNFVKYSLSAGLLSLGGPKSGREKCVTQIYWVSESLFSPENVSN